MADVAQRPTFPQQELETLRQQRLVTLRNARGDPDAIAALAFARGSLRSVAPQRRGADRDAGQHPGVDGQRISQAFHAAAYRPATAP